MDLLEHVADWARDAPLLLLIMARPDLLDVRPAWGGGRPNATSVLLEPLAEADAADLLRHLARHGAARRPRRGAHPRRRRGQPAVRRGGRRHARRRRRPRRGRRSQRGRADARSPSPRRSRRCSPRGSTASSRPSARSSRRRRSRARSSRASGSRRWSATASRDSVDAHLRALVRKDLIRPVGADDGHVPLPPPAHPRRAPTTACRRSCAPSCTSASRTGWRRGRRPVPVVDELLGHHLERAVLLRRELGETEDATAAARRARVGAPRRRRPARGPARRPVAPRARCWSARPRSSAHDDAARGALLPAARGVALRGGPLAEAIGVLDEAIARAPGPRLDAPARESSASSSASSPRRASGPSAPVGRRRRGAPGARARGRRRRAVPRLVPARAGRVDRRARRVRPTTAWCEAARLRAARGRRARAVPDPRHARDRGRARTHSGRRGDRRCEEFRELVGGEPGGGRADGQPARVAARDAGRVRARRRASCARPTRRSTSSAAWAGCHTMGAGAPARGPARPGRAPAARGRRAARRRWATASCWRRR